MGTHRSGYFKVNQAATLDLFDTGFRRFWLLVLMLFLLAGPWLVATYITYIANLTLIAIMGALALNLLTGYAGQISLGHAAFMAIGGFFSYQFAALGLPFVVVLPLTMAVGVVIGLIVGAPALRLRGLYLVLATVGFHYIVEFLANTYQTSGDDVAMNLTGMRLPIPDLGLVELDDELSWYYFLLFLLLMTTHYTLNLVRTRPGRAWIALRDRDIVAEALGIQTARHKLYAFAVSSALTCMTGALLVYMLGTVSAEYYSITVSITYLAMVVIGGAGSILGSYLGAIFVTLLPYGITWAFETIGASAKAQTTYLVPSQIIAFGVVMILFLIFEPRGLVGIWVRIRTYFEFWPLRQTVLEERK